jgi:tRNA nucleotidyltransferase (CCA-adding enzyme)
MKLSELLQSLDRIAKENNISTPYIVGGLPRDRVFGTADDIKDVDITTGDNGSFALAMAASREWPEAHFRAYNDGHSSVDFKNIRLDFSNNFKLPEIKKKLSEVGIDDPSDIQKERYSRDFTINTLLQPMDLDKPPVDATGKALEDIKNKVLRTPVDPELTIGHDARRILRAVKLALQFDLEIDPELEKIMVKYRGGIKELPTAHVKKQVNQMLNIDTKKALDMLTKYKLLPIIPLSRLMTLEIAKNRMVQHLLESQEI